MKKEETIKKLEKRQTELKEQFNEIISQPISDNSIKDAETTGVDIISESINNGIMLDILNWDDDTKLSKTALEFKNSKQK
jgi:hypothetical protein